VVSRAGECGHRGKDQALAALDEALANHSSMMVMLEDRAGVTVLHGDPHFQELVAQSRAVASSIYSP